MAQADPSKNHRVLQEARAFAARRRELAGQHTGCRKQRDGADMSDRGSHARSADERPISQEEDHAWATTTSMVIPVATTAGQMSMRLWYREADTSDRVAVQFPGSVSMYCMAKASGARSVTPYRVFGDACAITGARNVTATTAARSNGDALRQRTRPQPALGAWTGSPLAVCATSTDGQVGTPLAMRSEQRCRSNQQACNELGD